MNFIYAIFAKLALVSANCGAGLASLWSTYQPKEPEMRKSK